jgi:hypothetical protein
MENPDKPEPEAELNPNKNKFDDLRHFIVTIKEGINKGFLEIKQEDLMSLFRLKSLELGIIKNYSFGENDEQLNANSKSAFKPNEKKLDKREVEYYRFNIIEKLNNDFLEIELEDIVDLLSKLKSLELRINESSPFLKKGEQLHATPEFAFKQINNLIKHYVSKDFPNHFESFQNLQTCLVLLRYGSKISSSWSQPLTHKLVFNKLELVKDPSAFSLKNRIALENRVENLLNSFDNLIYELKEDVNSENSSHRLAHEFCYFLYANNFYLQDNMRKQIVMYQSLKQRNPSRIAKYSNQLLKNIKYDFFLNNKFDSILEKELAATSIDLIDAVVYARYIELGAVHRKMDKLKEIHLN